MSGLIFIIGISRTGSKFYLQVLNSSKKIYIAPELVFRHPFKKDLFSLFKKYSFKNDIQLFIDELYSIKLKDTITETLNKIDKSDIKKEIERQRQKLTPYEVFEIILKLAAKYDHKTIAGSKFPVHYSYTEELLKNYQDCKILYLIRDPREVYYSHLIKKRKEKENRNSRIFHITGFILTIVILLNSIIQWYKSIVVYERLIRRKKWRSSIMLFPFEDILKNEKKVVDSLSKYLEDSSIEYNKLKLDIVDSSFLIKPNLNRWKSKLNLFEKILFKLLIGRKMRKYEYI